MTDTTRVTIGPPPELAPVPSAILDACVHAITGVGNAELRRRGQSLATLIRAQARPGERAVIFMEAGATFVEAMIGCVYAEIVPVPICFTGPAELEVERGRWSRVVNEVKPATLLTSREVSLALVIPAQAAWLAALPRIIVDHVAGAASASPLADAATEKTGASSNGCADADSQDRQALEQALRREIGRHLGIPEGAIGPQTLVGSLGLDSLAVAQLCTFAYDRFGISVPPAAFLEEHTLTSLCAAVTRGSLDGVVAAEALPTPPLHRSAASVGNNVDFSLAYFPTGNLPQSERFSLMLRTAQLADRRGFSALWIPERHFHPFGGSCPNPAVIAAAMAATTQRIRLRAGSVVLPLHHPIRVAEEWSVVDNLSAGRVDLAFASGWNANDFVLAPTAFADRRNVTLSGIEAVRRLWRGEELSLPNGVGVEAPIRIQPETVRKDLQVWYTCTSGTESFLLAGAHGFNVLTGLLFQSLEELSFKLALYRQARERNGHDPDAGRVTLMVHTYVGDSAADVKKQVRGPLTTYLASSVDLWQQEAERLRGRTPDEQAALLDFAVERYQLQSALIGTPEACAAFVARLRTVGVDEIACLVDFGLSTDLVLGGLERLDQVRRRFVSSAALSRPHVSSVNFGASE